MKEKTGMNTGGHIVMFQVDDDTEAPEPIDPREVPGFHFEAGTMSEAFAAAAPDIGLLAFFNLLFFAGAFAGFLRYDLR